MTAPSTSATPGAAGEHTPTPSKGALLPKDFARAVQHIVDTLSGDEAHAALDKVVTEQLTSLGYGKGMAIFLEAVSSKHLAALEARAQTVRVTVENCKHEGWSFAKDGRCCRKCGGMIVDFGD